MPEIYLPVISSPGAPPPRTRPQFGVGVKSQSRIPTSRTLALLDPPIYYNWGPWAAPAWMETPGTEHGYSHPAFQPMSWNPPEALPSGATADMAAAWMNACVAGNPGKAWLIGNEPVRAEPPYEAWCPVDTMAEHCIAFARYHGVNVMPFGGIATQQEDFDYGDALRRRLLAAGVVPVAWHWHIYPDTVERFVFYLERVLTWAAGLPVIISETNFWPGTVADNQRLMELIVEILARRPELSSVYWYVNWEPSHPTLPNKWQLLDRNAPDAQLTETGKLYVSLTQ